MRVIISREAAANLDDIHAYYRRIGVNRKILAWLDGLTAAILALSETAETCPLAPEAVALQIPVRQRLYGTRHGRYRIFFVITPLAVNVLHIRHGARNLATFEDLGSPPSNIL